MFRGLEMLLDTRCSVDAYIYTRRGHLRPLLVTGRLVFWRIVVRAVAYQCSNSRQGVPCRSFVHASPPRPPLHYGQRYPPTFNGSSYHTFPLSSSKLKTIRVSYCCCCCAADKLYVRPCPVGVGVDVLEGEKRAAACSGTPKATKQDAAATVRAKKKRERERKIERKSQRCDLEARKTRRPPWPSMTPQ